MPSNIPMYVFTGFLESGKTKFIQETLEDERFNTGERTLLLVFEEGEEEYDVSAYPHKNVYPEVIDQSAITRPELEALLDEAENEYCAELSDDDLEQVSAAGEVKRIKRRGTDEDGAV